MRRNLGAHEYPRLIEFVESIPKTPNGKVDRRSLRERVLGSAHGRGRQRDRPGALFRRRSSRRQAGARGDRARRRLAAPVSLSEIAREVGLPKSSAHALIRTLDNEGYLQRDDRGEYSLGPRLLRLLGSLPHRFELPRVARPIMQELVDELGETAILGIRQGDAIVYVEQVEAPQVIRYVAPLGEPRPLHATSIGKVHLASMPPDESDALLGEHELREAAPTAR